MDHKEVRVPKNSHLNCDAGEDSCESLGVPWTASLDSTEIKRVNPKENQSRIFIGRTDAEAEAQYFGHLMQTADSLEKILTLGKIEGPRRSGQQRMRWLDGIIDSMDMNLGKLWETVRNRGAWRYGTWGREESDRTW